MTNEESYDDNAIDTPTVIPTPRRLRKTLDAFKLVEAGLTPRQALQTTNFRQTISGAAVSKFSPKFRQYTLTRPGTVKLAESQVRRILKAKAREVVKEKTVEVKEGIETVKEITQYIHPSDSNILAAAGMVYDRYEPVRQLDGAGNTQINIGQVITAEAGARIAEAMARLPIIEVESQPQSQPQGRPAESLGVDLGVSGDSDPGK